MAEEKKVTDQMGAAQVARRAFPPRPGRCRSRRFCAEKDRCIDYKDGRGLGDLPDRTRQDHPEPHHRTALPSAAADYGDQAGAHGRAPADTAATV